jgi:bisphosphoglycerate-independent phosphoglycerate mutase (AlkP superfamily)
MTDIIGHRTDMGAAIEEIELLDAFLGALIKLLDPENDLLFITSDHGNIEDISVKTHTFNKVPTILIGKVPEGVLGSISSLLDITPSVLKIFDKVGSSISNKGDSNIKKMELLAPAGDWDSFKAAVENGAGCCLSRRQAV